MPTALNDILKDQELSKNYLEALNPRNEVNVYADDFMRGQEFSSPYKNSFATLENPRQT